MKKVITLVASMATLMVAGQNFYNPSVSTKSYAELTNGVRQSEYPGNPGLYLLSLPKPVMLFDEPTDIRLTIGAGGYIVSKSSTHSFAIDPFLADMVEGSTNSGIYVEFDSTSTPHRLSIEWRNMTPVAHPITDYVNFIAHIYSDQSVEFHYGPSQVTGITAFNGKPGPFVGLIIFSGSFGNPIEYHKIIDDPASPTFAIGPNPSTLSSVPADGTVYRYEPYNINLEDISLENMKVYPNPVSDRLTIEGFSGPSVQAISLNGKETSTIQVTEGEADVSQLKPGCYLLRTGKGTEGKPNYLKILKK